MSKLTKVLCHKQLLNHQLQTAIQRASMSTNAHYDMIIVGGGIVGNSMACAMAKNTKLADKRVLVLDGAPKPKPYDRANWSNRVFALHKGSVDLFQSIGIWDKIEEVRTKNVKQMQVWDARSNALITFNHDNFSGDVACIADNDVISELLFREAESAENVEMRNLAKIAECKLPASSKEKSQVTLENSETFSCDLLIGADGANSIVRKKMDVDYVAIPYNQMGVVATLDISEGLGDNSVAWQRFLPDGVVALLPLSETQSSLVWSTSTAKAKQLLQMSPTEFVDAINNAFWKEYSKDQFTSDILKAVESLLGDHSQTVRQLPPAIKSVAEKSRAAFPLGFGHASTYVSKGVALIGDAAHRIHPMAGQGLNLGLGDVKCLADMLADAAYSGHTLDNLTTLNAYQSKRLLNNVPIMVGVHGLQRLYGTDFSPVVFLRSLGLQVTNSVPVIKKFFMDRAMA